VLRHGAGGRIARRTARNASRQLIPYRKSRRQTGYRLYARRKEGRKEGNARRRFYESTRSSSAGDRWLIESWCSARKFHPLQPAPYRRQPLKPRPTPGNYPNGIPTVSRQFANLLESRIITPQRSRCHEKARFLQRKAEVYPTEGFWLRCVAASKIRSHFVAPVRQHRFGVSRVLSEEPPQARTGGVQSNLGFSGHRICLDST
jgi:hypothetical protein